MRRGIPVVLCGGKSTSILATLLSGLVYSCYSLGWLALRLLVVRKSSSSYSTALVSHCDLGV